MSRAMLRQMLVRPPEDSQHKIIRHDSAKQCYDMYKQLYIHSFRDHEVLKHQYFQLLSDLLPITVIMLNRDCKAGMIDAINKDYMVCELIRMRWDTGP